MAAYKAIRQEAEGLDKTPIQYFATTLILVISKPFPCGWFVSSYAVGDGALGIYRKDDEVILLNDPEGGDYAGQTRFLTMSEIWDSHGILNRIKFSIVEDFTALIAMSDGVSDPKFPTDNDLRDTRKWHEFWGDLGAEVKLDKQNARAHEELLAWLNFWSVGNHDDRSIVVLLP